MAESTYRPSLRSVLIGLGVALVAGGVLLRWTAPKPEQLAPLGEATTVRRIETRRVRALPVRAQVDVAGVLEPRRSVKLYAETRGPVIGAGAEELDRVDAGQLLVEIDPLLARVAVEQAQAALARTQSELALARSNLDRRRSLAGRGVASVSDLDDASNAERVAAAALREARAELTRARDELTKKAITAPFAGVLRSFPVEVGEYVQEGQRLAELLDLGTARAKLGLADREVVAVRAGQPVRARVEVYPGEDFEGAILRVGAASDATTKKFPVEVELPNAEGRLLPGMIVRVLFDLGESRERMLIPRDATADEFGLRFVYKVAAEAGGERLVARRRRVGVRSVPFRPAVFEVVEGLVEGDEIAITGVRELRDGETVQRDGTEPR
jgi:RND family efflux transporter MFP subunit